MLYTLWVGLVLVCCEIPACAAYVTTTVCAADVTTTVCAAGVTTYMSSVSLKCAQGQNGHKHCQVQLHLQVFFKSSPLMFRPKSEAAMLSTDLYRTVAASLT